MRILEYAKEHNLSSKDVVETLKQNGHNVTDHLSELNSDMTALLDRTIGGTRNYARPRTPRPGGTEGGARPSRPVGDRAGAPYAPRGPRPVGQLGTTDAVSDDKRTPWKRPGATPRIEAVPAATALVEKKPAGKKKASLSKKRSTAKAKESRDDETETVQIAQQTRANRETLITPPLVEKVTIEGDLSLLDAAALMKKAVSEVIFVLLKKNLRLI